MGDPQYASHEDVRDIIRAVGESTAAVSNLAIKLEHQSSLFEASEKRNEKRLDKLEDDVKHDREKSGESRKAIHEDISKIKQRLKPVEGMSKVISQIGTKIIGSLAVTFIGGGVAIFAIIKAIG